MTNIPDILQNSRYLSRNITKNCYKSWQTVILLQNDPNLAELLQNLDILPCFLLHNAKIITFNGRQAVLIFVVLSVEKYVRNFFMLILII